MGRIHLGKQDFSDLQTRKMKGLKRGRDGDVNGDGDELPDVNEGEILGLKMMLVVVVMMMGLIWMKCLIWWMEMMLKW